MGFRKGAYATVWTVEGVSPTLTKARVSISRKNKEGIYEQDFSGFVAFIGSAAATKALGLRERDRIKLGDIDVSNRYDSEAKREYTDYKVFSFDMADEVAPKNSTPDIASETLSPEDEANLPF